MNHLNTSNVIQSPLVSVVTPAYNAMPYIIETIESVQAQDYPIIEHIIMDGGSVDGTVDILKRYPHLIWTSEPDRGQSHALNKGLQLARGEIIGWLNADDTYRPGAVSTAVRGLVEHLEVGLVYSDLQVVDGLNRPGRILRSQPFSLSTFFDITYIRQPTVFMRRNVIETLRGVDERLHFVMDYEFWLRASLHFKMLYLPGVVSANFRYTAGTKSVESAEEFDAEWLGVLERAFEDPIYQQIPSQIRSRALRKAHERCYIANLKKAADEHDRQAMLQNLMWALSIDWKLVGNRGLWAFLVQGLFGIKMKYRKRYDLP
jgi:glycosyltransferase involved in cell wall biosynthesis